jgi:hypothetical protein
LWLQLANAGAIATGACIHPGAAMSVRFKFFMDKLSDAAGGEHVGFSEVRLHNTFHRSVHSSQHEKLTAQLEPA